MNNFLSEQVNFQRFREAYKTKSKRLIVFSGAGASLEAGLPTWGEFIDRLKNWAIQNTETTVANAILEAKIAALPSLDTDWDRVEELAGILKLQFENAVRDVLSPKKPNDLPTFSREVWKLNPNALLTVNLDGFALKSHAALKSGAAPRYFTGSQVTLSREIFSDSRPLIVDLHGALEVPESWVLTKSQYEKLISNKSYPEFLKSIFNHNIILFY